MKEAVPPPPSVYLIGKATFPKFPFTVPLTPNEEDSLFIMKAAHYLFIFLSIYQSNILDTTASLVRDTIREGKLPHDAALGKAPKLWLPYKVPLSNRFFAEARRSAQASSSGRQTGPGADLKKSISMKKIIKKMFGKKTSTEAEASDAVKAGPRTVELFESIYRTDDTAEGRVKLAKEAVYYLLNYHELPEEEVAHWVKSIIKIGSNFHDGNYLDFHSTLFYGLHTLVLKYYNNPALRSSIADPLYQAMEIIRHEMGGAIISVWDKELFDPANGLSQGLSDWQTLEEQILYEWNLTTLRQGLANNEVNVAQHVRAIKQMFATENAGSYSAQSRVAAIAVLAEIIRHEGPPALEAAQKILPDAQTVNSGDSGIFLFPHEEMLLKTVTGKPANP